MKWNRESHAQFRSAGCFAIARLLLLLSHLPTDRTRPADLGLSTMWERAMMIRCMRTCRYRSCSADGDCAMISEASRRDLLAFCSPSAAITCKETHFAFLQYDIRPTCKNSIAKSLAIKLWRLQLILFFPQGEQLLFLIKQKNMP